MRNSEAEIQEDMQMLQKKLLTFDNMKSNQEEKDQVFSQISIDKKLLKTLWFMKEAMTLHSGKLLYLTMILVNLLKVNSIERSLDSINCIGLAHSYELLFGGEIIRGQALNFYWILIQQVPFPQRSEVTRIFYKSLVSIGLVYIFLALVLSHIDYFSFFFGQSTELAISARQYGKNILIGLFFQYLIEITCQFIQLMEKKYRSIQLIVNVIIITTHIVFLFYFSDQKDKNQLFHSITTAFNVSYFVGYLTIIFILFIEDISITKYEIGIRDAFEGSVEFLKVSIKRSLHLVNESLVFEVNLFLVLALCPIEQASPHIVCSIIIYLIFSLSFSVSLVLTLETQFAIKDLFKIRTQNFFSYAFMLGIQMGILGFIFVNVWNKSMIDTFFLHDGKEENHAKNIQLNELSQSLLQIGKFLLIFYMFNSCLVGFYQGYGVYLQERKLIQILLFGLGPLLSFVFVSIFGMGARGVWVAWVITILIIFSYWLQIAQFINIDETIGQLCLERKQNLIQNQNLDDSINSDDEENQRTL